MVVQFDPGSADFNFKNLIILTVDTDGQCFVSELIEAFRYATYSHIDSLVRKELLQELVHSIALYCIVRRLRL